MTGATLPNSPQGQACYRELTLANTHADAGEMDAAIQHFRAGLDIFPSNSLLHDDLVYLLSFHPGYSDAQIAAELAEFQRRHAEPLASTILPHSNTRDPNKRLKIGYVSPEFCRQAEAFFVIPLLEAHNHGPFEIHCYSSIERGDDNTDRIRKSADVWHDVVKLDDAQLAQKIRGDGIDILVDLTMHMRTSRMLTFARKPAPIQICWLAYPGSTGLHTIDYRVTDAFLDPPNLRSPFIERPLYLPDCWICFNPLSQSALATPRTSGPITFGSLNHPRKVNDANLRLWASILQRVDKSRFILHIRSEELRLRATAIFNQAGIASDRLEFLPLQPRWQYLRTYDRIDFALDTLPYNGITTTCDALWMGTPVLSLVGNTIAGRAALGILTTLGLPNLAAANADQFIETAVALAKNRDYLADLRKNLRARMQNSPLMDSKRFAANFETAYRTIWRRYCQQPDAESLFLQAALHARNRQYPDALNFVRQAIALQPQAAKNHLLLGVILKESGDLNQSIVSLRLAQSLATADATESSKITGFLNSALAERHVNAGIAFLNHAKLDDAILEFKSAIQLQPDSTETHNNLGVALQKKGLFDESIAVFRHAIDLNPNFHLAHANLGNILAITGDIDNAVESCQRAIQLKPENADAHVNLGNAFKESARLDEAVSAYRRAIELDPDLVEALSNLAYVVTLHPDFDSAMILREARNWAARFERPRSLAAHSGDRSPDRKLRIGYVSCDFRNHVIARNIAPLFTHRDASQFEVACYASVLNPDTFTRRFQALSDTWRQIAGETDDAVAQMIRNDRIDILVDLAVHTSGNRLGVFARKPAPVQFTFAGYPGTTGLNSIDYRLTDPYLDPPGISDQFYSEQSIRLTHSFWCYDPDPMQVSQDFDVVPLPALTNKRLTFGCLSNPCKLNASIFQTWSKVLAAVPSSQLLLISPPGKTRQRFLQQFSSLGIDPSRIDFVSRQDRPQYLRTFNRIDICLDTLPYNGHTTGLDSLWMGVPVVTQVGRTVVGRAGLSQLTNLGLPHLAAGDESEFVQIATKLAADLPALADLRGNLRQRMRRSALTDSRGFTRSIESAYRQAWRRWCSDPNPGSF